MEGPLSKWTNLMNGWQYRWFVLDNSTGLLSYYTSKEKMVRGTRRGCVRLKGAIVGIDNEDDSTFTITDEARTFHFQAQDGDEREKWIRALEDAVIHHSTIQKKWDLNEAKSSMADFDRRLTESDAYLQILIEQSSNLDMLIEKASNNREKSRIQVILANLNQIIESVKHCIVLLQIAKNTAFPVYGSYTPVTVTDASTMQNADRTYINGEMDRPSRWDSHLVSANNRQTCEVGQIAHPNADIPERSYCSSDDDDFVDFDDDDLLTPNQSTLKTFEDAVEILPKKECSSAAGGTCDSSLVAECSKTDIHNKFRCEEGINL